MTKLGDKSYQPQPIHHRSFQITFKRLSQSCGFIHPEATWLLFWNLLMGLVVGYNFVEIPIRIFITKDVNLTR